MTIRRDAVTSVVLVALAIGALAYAYRCDPGSASDAERAARVGRVFPRFSVAEVRAVRLERGTDVLELDRAPEVDAGAGSWAIRAPRFEPADPAAVEALLEDMNVAARVRDVTLDARTTGLAAPRVRGRVRLGAMEYLLALGAPAPVPAGAAYMSLEGEGTFVADRLLVDDLLRSVDAYRDRVLVPYGAPETRLVTVRPSPYLDAGGGFTLTRAGATFRVDGSLRASRAVVDRVFAALGEAHADSFLAEGQTDPSRDLVSIAVTLEATEQARPLVDLRFGGPCPRDDAGVVVTQSSPVRRSVCVPGSARWGLLPSDRPLVDHGLFHARADEISELRLEPVDPKGPALDLARRGRGWHQRSPDDRDLTGADAEAAEALASRLTSLQADAVRPGAVAEPFPARSKVTLVRVDGATEVVEVALPVAGGASPALAVRRLDDGALLSLPPTAALLLEARTVH